MRKSASLGETGLRFWPGEENLTMKAGPWQCVHISSIMAKPVKHFSQAYFCYQLLFVLFAKSANRNLFQISKPVPECIKTELYRPWAKLLISWNRSSLMPELPLSACLPPVMLSCSCPRKSVVATWSLVVQLPESQHQHLRSHSHQLRPPWN